ncbi:MAG: hypothetical protein ACI9OO_001225 [Bacteroidia bacterium]|jgi:hypothetical protein
MKIIGGEIISHQQPYSSIFETMAVFGREHAVVGLRHCRRSSGEKYLEGWHPDQAIGAALNRSPSTISREVAKNGGRFRCRVTEADKLAWKNAKRPAPWRRMLG